MTWPADWGHANKKVEEMGKKQYTASNYLFETKVAMKREAFRNNERASRKVAVKGKEGQLWERAGKEFWTESRNKIFWEHALWDVEYDITEREGFRIGITVCSTVCELTTEI